MAKMGRPKQFDNKISIKFSYVMNKIIHLFMTKNNTSFAETVRTFIEESPQYKDIKNFPTSND